MQVAAIEAVLGPALRGAYTIDPDGTTYLKVRWACGCIANGTNHRDVDVELCAPHRAAFFDDDRYFRLRVRAHAAAVL